MSCTLFTTVQYQPSCIVQISWCDRLQSNRSNQSGQDTAELGNHGREASDANGKASPRSPGSLTEGCQGCNEGLDGRLDSIDFALNGALEGRSKVGGGQTHSGADIAENTLRSSNSITNFVNLSLSKILEIPSDRATGACGPLGNVIGGLLECVGDALDVCL